MFFKSLEEENIYRKCIVLIHCEAITFPKAKNSSSLWNYILNLSYHTYMYVYVPLFTNRVIYFFIYMKENQLFAKKKKLVENTSSGR